MPEDTATPVWTTPAPVDPSLLPEDGDTGGIDLTIAVLFAVVVVLVIAQNVWLRRRAEHEDEDPQQDEDL